MTQPNNPRVEDWVSKVLEEQEYLFSKNIIDQEFVLADYLCLSEEDILIEKQRWLFKCRVEVIDIKENHR